MKKLLYLLALAMLFTSCGEVHQTPLEDQIKLYGENTSVSVSFFSINTGEQHTQEYKVSHLLDGTVWQQSRGSYYSFYNNSIVIENEIFRIYTSTPNDTIYSLGLATGVVGDTSSSVSLYVNGISFECVAGNTITIGEKVYTTNDILRIASTQDTGVEMLTGKTYYEVLGDNTAYNILQNKRPSNLKQVTIKEK